MLEKGGGWETEGMREDTEEEVQDGGRKSGRWRENGRNG